MNLWDDSAQAFAVVAIVVGGVMYEGAHPIKSLMNIPDNARLGFGASPLFLLTLLFLRKVY